MANSAFSIPTGPKEGIPSNNIPFLFYESINQTKPQPLIVFLHGAGEGSPTGTMPNAGQHNTVTVRSLEQNGHGLMTLTASANLPTFTHPYDVTQHFDYFMIAPQQYYPEGTNRGNGIIWPYIYITECIRWAQANRNIDPTRIYITGLSLGGGGTIDMCSKPFVRQLLAAGAASCPGYGNGSSVDLPGLAKSGFPLWIVAAADDFVPQGTNTVCVQIVNKLNAATNIPLRPPRFNWYLSGGHGIWYRLYDVRDNVGYPGWNGISQVHDISMFRWFLQFQNKTTVQPTYI